MKYLLTLLVLLAACGGRNAIPWPRPCITAEQNCRFVAEIIVVTSSQRWVETPWARLGDIVPGQTTVLVTGDGSGCIATDAIAAVARPGEMWVCPTPWRQPRRGF